LGGEKFVLNIPNGKILLVFHRFWGNYGESAAKFY
jgi:hypothetical protein